MPQSSENVITVTYTELLSFFLHKIAESCNLYIAFGLPIILCGIYIFFRNKSEKITLWFPVKVCLCLSILFFAFLILCAVIPFVDFDIFVFAAKLFSGCMLAVIISALLQAITKLFLKVFEGGKNA